MRRILIALLAVVLAGTAGCTSAHRSAAAATAAAAAAPSGPDPLAGATPAADPGPAGAVLTQRGDDARTGWSPAETQLSVASVGSSRFGLRAQLPVDGKIYAQPLYVPALSVGGAAHDVVIVATEHDSVYAFDAHATGGDAQPLWHASLLAAGARPMEAATDRVAGGRLCDSITPEVGITGTPVIDWSTRTLYAMALDVEAGQLTYRIHALDVTTGREVRPSAVVAASVAGRGLDSVHGTVAFDATRAEQRMGLTLVNGVVYAGFASFCGWGTYHGWILGYRTADLSRTIVYNSSPDAYGAGFWESQAGIMVDPQGHLLVASGNGPFVAGGRESGDTLLKLSPQAGTLRPVDSFTPFDQECRNAHDQDLGSGSPLAVPGHDEYLLSSKTGAVYVLDAGHLGGYTALSNACPQRARTDVDRIKQELTVGSVPGGMWGTWAYWQGPGGEYVYSSGSGNRLTQWRLTSDGRLAPTPVAQAPLAFAAPGAIPVVSSDGSAPGTGVVWTVDQTSGAATLRAFDAADISHQVWSGPLDSSGGFNHFEVPTVAGGLVFAGGESHLEVYGLS